MKCVNHPDVDAVTTCSMCGKPICAECRTMIRGKEVCIGCQEEWLIKQATSGLSGR